TRLQHACNTPATRLQHACNTLSPGLWRLGSGGGVRQFRGGEDLGLRDVFGGIRVVIPKAETRGPEEIRNPKTGWSVITPDRNSLAPLKDTWGSAGAAIVR